MVTHDDSDILKPCPFCGHDAEICTMPAEDGEHGAGAMFIQCTYCMASSCLIYPLGDDPVPLLLEKWNRRPIIDSEAALATPQLEPVVTLICGEVEITSNGAEQYDDNLEWHLPAVQKLSAANPGARIDLYAGTVPATPFQDRVQPWMLECFGAEIAADRKERNHRFFEEAAELVQACEMTRNEAHQLVDYVYGRTIGEKRQEAGGVMVTLAALCLANDMDMHVAGETELTRIWTKVDQIRAKQAAKPKHSPLLTSPATPVLSDEEFEGFLKLAADVLTDRYYPVNKDTNIGLLQLKREKELRALFAKVRP